MASHYSSSISAILAEPPQRPTSRVRQRSPETEAEQTEADETKQHQKRQKKSIHKSGEQNTHAVKEKKLQQAIENMGDITEYNETSAREMWLETDSVLNLLSDPNKNWSRWVREGAIKKRLEVEEYYKRCGYEKRTAEYNAKQKMIERERKDAELEQERQRKIRERELHQRSLKSEEEQAKEAALERQARAEDVYTGWGWEIRDAEYKREEEELEDKRQQKIKQIIAEVERELGLNPVSMSNYNRFINGELEERSLELE